MGDVKGVSGCCYYYAINIVVGVCVIFVVVGVCVIFVAVGVCVVIIIITIIICSTFILFFSAFHSVLLGLSQFLVCENYYQ